MTMTLLVAGVDEAGRGPLAGPVVGGVIVGFVPEGLRAMEIKPEVQWIIYGVLMVLVVYFLPRGIVPAIQGYMDNRRTRAVAANAMAAAPEASQK